MSGILAPERAGAAPPLREVTGSRGRTVHFCDTGEPDRHPVVFFGGLGTSAGAFTLTEFCACQERDRLALRFVCVERNGFGATEFTPGLGYAEAVDDVLAVLTELGIERFSVVAVSGGGPYAARLVAAVPGRVASLHLAAAVSGRPLGADAFVGDLEAIARDPAAFWEYPAGSAVHGIPGFVDAAQAEGRRALPDPARAVAALRHELKLISTGGLSALHGLKAPAYLYWGAGDTIVPIAHAAGWWVALPAAVVRVYPDAGHDVQYAHWNDILRDIAEAAG